MATQQGGTILLAYGPQGSQQQGGAIVLSYQAAPAAGRRITAGTGAPWGAAVEATLTTNAHHAAATEERHHAHAGWAAGQDQDRSDASAWGVARATDDARTGRWPAFGKQAQPAPTSPLGVSATRDRQERSHWDRFTGRAHHQQHGPWRGLRPQDWRALAPWDGPMHAQRNRILVVVVPSAPADQLDTIPWSRYSRTLNPGWGVPTPPNPLPEPGEPVIVPVRKVYIVQNETLLLRVSDMASVPVTRMTLRLDVDSWTWGFSATIPGQALPLVEPTDGQPVELEAIINGVQFRVLAERLARDRSFGRADIAITGRGKAALLDAPYAPALTFASDTTRTAQQLAGDVLTVNGVPMDWTVAWGLEDWSVPPGAWNHQGSYMSALVRIAQAVGGYIRPDPLLQELNFLHRYPTMPDTWAGITAPDYDLPASISQRESIEWTDRPGYDAVYVSGVQAGVLGYVKKAGSAGTTHAPMATEALITATEAARQRGRAILADTGRMAMVTLRVPVLEALGVIEPGKFVKYTDGGTERIGIVRSTEVQVERPGVWQTIGVETHVA